MPLWTYSYLHVSMDGGRAVREARHRNIEPLRHAYIVTSRAWSKRIYKQSYTQSPFPPLSLKNKTNNFQASQQTRAYQNDEFHSDC